MPCSILVLVLVPRFDFFTTDNFGDVGNIGNIECFGKVDKFVRILDNFCQLLVFFKIFLDNLHTFEFLLIICEQ